MSRILSTRHNTVGLCLWLALAAAGSSCGPKKPGTDSPVSPCTPENPCVDPSKTAKGPVGWDLYRRLDELPIIPVGVRSMQFSSFDRHGGNDDGFSGQFSCLRTMDNRCVIAEATGAGEIVSIWFTRGEIVGDDLLNIGDLTKTGTMTVVLDGETVLDASLQRIVDGELGAPFVYPLVANSDQSSGGVNIRVPMPYQKSMLVVTDDNPMFYHVSYRTFADSDGVTRFDPSDEAQDVLELLSAAGTRDPKPAREGAQTTRTPIDLAPGQSVTLAEASGSGSITRLRVKLAQTVDGGLLSGVRLQIKFDGKTTVDSPVGEFFGSGLGVGETPVRSLFFAMELGGWYSAWWPMPFAQSAQVTLVNGSSEALSGGTAEVTTVPDSRWVELLKPDGGAGHFTAISRAGMTSPGQDWILVDNRGTGKLVGASLTMRGEAFFGNIRSYLEGDERITVDGFRTPQWHGTGTEDFFESGWYFYNGLYSTPFHGSSGNEWWTETCDTVCDSAYRLMISDAVPYRANVRFGIEHGALNEVRATYSSTAFLYTKASFSSHVTDTFYVGDAAAAAAHEYVQSGTSEESSLTSSYEGDDDEIPITASVHSTEGTVSFRLTIDPLNQVVVLHRMSDQYVGGQSATVQVDGIPAGTWLQPSGNEQHRWLDDAFCLPAALTSGKEAITVSLRSSDSAWTAARYAAQSLVSSFADAAPPSRVDGLVGRLDPFGGIVLGWREADDDTGIAFYEVHGARAGESEQLLGTSFEPGFVQIDPGYQQSWTYRVRAVDFADRVGPFSQSTSTVAGNKIRIEGEALHLTSGTEAEIQSGCCGVFWSGNQQLWVKVPQLGDSVGLVLDIPATGTYILSALMTQANDYGIVQFAVDGADLGSAFDGYHDGIVVSGPVPIGSTYLTAGSHTLRLTLTGQNPSALSYYEGSDVRFLAGLDLLFLEIQ